MESKLSIRDENLASAMLQLQVQQEQHQALGSQYDSLTRRAGSLEGMVASTNVELTTVANFKRELEGCEERLVREVALRKGLHNKLVDLVGSIRVVCRVRPPAAFDPDETGEDGSNFFSTIAFGDKSGGSTFGPSRSNGSDAMNGPSNLFENELVLRDAGGRTRGQYEFEACFSPSSSQRDVFRYIEPLLGSVIDGYNLVLIAYGRTGAGKTFTMNGKILPMR